MTRGSARPTIAARIRYVTGTNPRGPATPTHQTMNDPDAEFEYVWRMITEDVVSFGAAAQEFPLTVMTRALAESLWRLHPEMIPLECRRAIDVGTGSGVHAIMMASRGFADVLAVDLNSDATQLAAARASRLLDRGRCRAIAFRDCALDEVGSGDGGFGLITFNPPSFYDFGAADSLSPAFTGVYGDLDWHQCFMPEKSPLYRLFDKIVLPHLCVGGHLICTWPAIERRNVEDMTDAAGAGEPASPARLLRRWFHIDVDGVGLGARDFFSRSAAISSDYGLGDGFWANLYLGVARHVYSRLLETRSADRPSFRFGVLHLVRRSERQFDVYSGGEEPRSHA